MQPITTNGATPDRPFRPGDRTETALRPGSSFARSPEAFETLLVHVEASTASDDRLRVAVGLAKDFGAALIGIGGRTPAYIADPWLCATDGAAVQLVQDQEDAALAETEARFHVRTRELGAAATWRAIRSDATWSLPNACAAADLVIAGPVKSAGAGAAAAGDLVMRAGVPVLSIPPGLRALDVTDVVVAWKNTREARRAVTDALAFLRRAATVTVVQVASESEKDWSGLQDIVARLQAHGVRAAAQMIPRGEAEAETVLLDFIAARACQLVVAGAYGHSHAREWLLGGMTQALVQRCATPILFSR